VAFTYDPTTDAGKVRLYLRDNREDRAAFTDAEIAVFLSIAGTWQRATAEAAKALLADRARFARVYTQSEDNKSRTEDELAGAAYLKDLIAQWGGGAVVLQQVTVTYMGRHPSDPRLLGT
jgi:hypothetical protein